MRDQTDPIETEYFVPNEKLHQNGACVPEGSGSDL